LDGSSKRILPTDDELPKGSSELMFSKCFIKATNRTAVELYKIHRPEIVLMDITTPVTDGVHTTTKIFGEAANIEI